MPFKVGQQQFVSIANLKQKGKEVELKKYDVNRDNLLDKTEAARYYADKTGGVMTSLDEVYRLAGGKQRETKVLTRTYPMGWAPDWKGDFNIPGVGAGNVRTNRLNEFDPASGKTKDAFNFLIDCNLMERSFLENDLKSASIVIARKGFGKESGSQLAEQETIPLSVQTREAYTSFNRGGGSTQVPEEKYLCATVEVASLRTLAARSGGLSFYVRIETQDGRTLYLNPNGQPKANFEISDNELKARR